MCGMQVCEWTQHELTLNIRFMGGEYDPGRCGRNREEDSKAESSGRDMSWRKKSQGAGSGANAMKWNAVFDLPGTGYVLPAECLILCRSSGSLDRAFIMATPNGEGESSSLWPIYLFVTLWSSLCPFHFPTDSSPCPFRFFEKHTSLNTKPT